MWRTPTARKEPPMDLGEPVKKILSYYESDNPGTKAIIGRNTFQRSKKDAIDMLSKIVKIYQRKD
jgi:DhnA family fructose-bisphosphate aldolase class Ia